METNDACKWKKNGLVKKMNPIEKVVAEWGHAGGFVSAMSDGVYGQRV